MADPTISIPFTSGEALLLAQLLDLCVDRWMNHGCSDFSLLAAGLTPEQVQGLMKAMQEVLPNEERYEGWDKENVQPDFALVGHFKWKVMKAAGLTKKDLPPIP